MQSFLLPSTVHKELDKTYKDFFWNKSDNYRPLIHWDEVCKSKKNGGMGLRKAEETNIALQLKLLWKIISEPENIWVKLIKEKYLKDVDLF